MTMYVGSKIQTAGPDHKGDMNNHVIILPDHVNSQSAPEKYRVIVRKDFYPTSGLRRQSSLDFYIDRDGARGWKNIETVCDNLSAEGALRLGRETAQKQNLALYLQGEFSETTIDWHPKDYEPRRE